MNTQTSLMHLYYTVCPFMLSNTLKCFSVITCFRAQHNAHRQHSHKFSFSHLPLIVTPKLEIIPAEIRGNSPWLESAERAALQEQSLAFGILVLLWGTPAGCPRLWQMQVLVEMVGGGSGLSPNRAPLSSRGTDSHASPQPHHHGRSAWLEKECTGGQLSDAPRVPCCWRCRAWRLFLTAFRPTDKDPTEKKLS